MRAQAVTEGWNSGTGTSEWVALPVSDIRERHGGLRLTRPETVTAMEASLRRHGQLSPIVVCPSPETGFEVIDGFKRLRAVRRIEEQPRLWARVLPVGVRAAKAAVLLLNWCARPVSDFEEALVVQSLCREDALTQVEVAALLDRDPSWVSRRLALVERLCEELREDLRLGLVKPTEAREVARMPRGMQPKVLEVIRAHGLGSRQTAGLCQALLAAGPSQHARILEDPERALIPAQRAARYDARLSVAGNECKRTLEDMASACQRVARSWSMQAFSMMRQDEWILLAPPAGQARQAAAAALRALDAAPWSREECGEPKLS